MVETILRGKPETPFLKAGDRVAIAMHDGKHRTIFGTIDQTVVAA
jgi:fumarylacetoacetate (FAA) hydrolase